MSRKFGRIPERTVELFEGTVALVKEKVVTALPAAAGDDLQALTLELVLKTIFRDWQEHGNTDLLSEDDLSDLSSFVQMAAALAGNQLQAQGKPVYEASLQGLLDDWLYNWNAEGQPGPVACKG